jgi:hypothetical protein
MTDEPVNIRREAEDRVRLRFERQTTALTQWQRQESEREVRLQSRAIGDSVARQASLELEKTLRLESHEREGRQARDRLANRPIPAPAFDMMGGPPPRNLVQDHDEVRQRWNAQRDRIVEHFDKNIAGCKAARAEMQDGFARADEARNQGHSADRLALAYRHQESFERLVNKEVERADRWTSREFKKRARDDNAHER